MSPHEPTERRKFRMHEAMLCSVIEKQTGTIW